MSGEKPSCAASNGWPDPSAHFPGGRAEISFLGRWSIEAFSPSAHRALPRCETSGQPSTRPHSAVTFKGGDGDGARHGRPRLRTDNATVSGAERRAGVPHHQSLLAVAGATALRAEADPAPRRALSSSLCWPKQVRSGAGGTVSARACLAAMLVPVGVEMIVVLDSYGHVWKTVTVDIERDHESPAAATPSGGQSEPGQPLARREATLRAERLASIDARVGSLRQRAVRGT